MSNHLAHVLEAKWRSDDVNTNEERDFSCLNLNRKILAGLTKTGYKIPSPVQLQAIPLCLTGDDVFVQGKAGTGKTLVFSILALTAALKAKDLKVLILAPTREGAFQIYSTICAIGSEIRNLKCECFIGGFNIKFDEPKTKECTIAVGTPGRILHLIEDEKLKTDTIQLFIIDDFDELRNKFMKPEVSVICDSLPEGKQTVVTSLTCTPDVIDLASEFLKEPYRSCFNDNEISLLGMTHYYRIIPVGRLPSLSYRMKLEVLKSVLFKAKFTQCIIFCNSTHRIEPLHIDIKTIGFSAESISKSKDQVERLRIVELLKQNKFSVLVSTDVSSRSLDAENVDLVINFDMPSTCRTYLHRCGRAGRYGAKCASITFLLKCETEMFDEIENEGQFISYVLPDPIPEDLNCYINPSAVPSNLSTTSNFNENFPDITTETSKNEIINVEETMAGKACSLRIIANENGQTDLEHSAEGSLAFIASKIEEQTVDLEIANGTHLMGDLEMIKRENECAEDYQDTTKINVSEPHLLPSCVENSELLINKKIDNQEPRVFNKEYESKNCEQEQSQETDLCSASETVPKRTIKPKSTSKLSEKYVLHKGIDEMPLDREENYSEKMATIPQATQHKKKSSKNIRKSSNKKSVKSLDHCKSQSKSEKQVSFCGLKTPLSEFDANQSCAKFRSECLADHMDKKKVNEYCKMHSSHGKYVDRFNCVAQRNPLHASSSSQPCRALSSSQPSRASSSSSSQPSRASSSSSSQPSRASSSSQPYQVSSQPCCASSQPCCASSQPCRASSQPCRASSQPCRASSQPCRASSQPCCASSQPCHATSQPRCHASSQPCCHFSNNYYQAPFPFYGNDIFYQQWMYINNLSNYI